MSLAQFFWHFWESLIAFLVLLWKTIRFQKAKQIQTNPLNQGARNETQQT